MTKEEVLEYIYSKQIPLKFIWEDKNEYNLYIFITNVLIVENGRIRDKSLIFSFYPEIKYVDMNLKGKRLFQSNRKPIEECISDFLFWFELNKHRCSKITYYEFK